MQHQRLVNFSALFGGRTDAYFLSGDKGGVAVWAPVTLPLFARHLSGDIEIGTYPVTDSAHCRWGCIDIDMPRHSTGDSLADAKAMADDQGRAWELANDVRAAWQFFGIHSWVERSRSKGFHIWVFSEWVSAAVMRDAGRYIANVAELDPKTEVNPKNEAPWLTKTGLVNTVRTPYSGRAQPGRMVMVDEQGGDIALHDFIDAACALRCKPAALQGLSVSQRLADRYRQQQLDAQLCQQGPARWGSKRSAAYQEAAQILSKRIPATAGQRDNQFYTMANLLHGTGTPYELAVRIITDVWNTNTDQDGFPLAQALQKVDRVYR
jgi:hypothetical protein